MNLREKKATPLSLPTRLGLLADRLMAPLFPTYAFKRSKSRLNFTRLHSSLENRLSQGGLKGARDTNNRYGRLRSGNSADADILPDLDAVVARSRERFYNDPLACGILKKRTHTVIGRGSHPQSKVSEESTGLSREATQKIRRDQERAWKRWADSPGADATGKLNFHQLQSQAFLQMQTCGEALALIVSKPRPWSPSDLAIQMIEPDRLDTPPGMSGNNLIRKGVQIDATGEVEGYWIRDTHPGDDFSWSSASSQSFRFFPLRDAYGRVQAVHLFNNDRPGQSRGVPLLAAVLDRLTDIDDASEATILKTIAIARVAYAIETNDLEGLLEAATTQELNERIHNSEGVEVHYLNQGEQAKVLADNSPSSTYDSFMRLNRKDLAMGVQMPYEAVSADRADSTYSSDRSGQMEHREVYAFEQYVVEQGFLRPIYRIRMEEAYLRGEWGAEVSPRQFYGDVDAYLEHLWIHKGWGWVDPKNDAEATRTKLETNLTSLAREYAAMGLDWEEELEQIAAEKNLMKRLGLTLAEAEPKGPPAEPEVEEEDE